MAADLYVDNNNLVRIRNVVDAITGDPITDMTGTVTLYDETQQVVANADALPISYASLAPVPFYYAQIPSTIQLVENSQYKAVFESTNYGVTLEKMFNGKKRTG